MLLHDMKQELMQPNLRRNYVDVEREGNPLSTDVGADAVITPPANDVIVEAVQPEPAAPPQLRQPESEVGRKLAITTNTYIQHKY